MTLLNRITSFKWNLRRVAYLILGLFAIINGIYDQQWFFVIAGIYFASMGLFALVCASGTCDVPQPTKSKLNGF